MARSHDSERDGLSGAEKRDLMKLIEQSKPLPEKYRFLLISLVHLVSLVCLVSLVPLPMFLSGRQDRTNRPDRPPQPFSYTPVLGQITQNPELITQNFPKRAG